MADIGTDLYLAYENGYEAGKKDTTPKWISVEERLPKEDEVVLVFGGRSIYTAYYGENRWGGIGWHKLNSKYHYCNPTHWMPLPEPPEKGDGEE